MTEFFCQCINLLKYKTSEALGVLIILTGWLFIKIQLSFSIILISIGTSLIVLSSIYYLYVLISNHRGEIEKIARQNNDSHWREILKRANKQHDIHTEQMISLTKNITDTRATNASEEKIKPDVSFR